MNDNPKSSTLLKCAVSASLLIPIVGVVIAVAFRQWVMFPGALLSLVLYGILGYFAVRGNDWARWTLFAFMLVTAVVVLVFAFVRPGGNPPVGFDPGLATVALFHGCIAVGLALRPRRGAG